MSVGKKVQHPVRIYEDDWEKLKVKTAADGISFQRLTEVLFRGYIKNNKEIRRLVNAFIEKYGTRKRRTGFDEIEADELLRLIEEKHSPLRHIYEVDEEFDDDE